MNTAHDELNDSLDGLFGSKFSDTPREQKAPPSHFVPAAERFSEGCAKCRGTGMWRPGYPCFACKGEGRKVFKTSPQDRASSRAGNQRRRETQQAEQIAAFKTEHPEVYA